MSLATLGGICDVRASLDVHVKSDGGDLFQDVNVNRGRSMKAAQE